MLSFVVPVYKTPEPLLRNCLDSILKYSRPMELICVLDSPGDLCGQIIDEYEQKDARVKVLKNDCNRGVSYSRNRGMSVAQGTYLAFVDADDEIIAETYEKGFEAVDRNGFGGIAFTSGEEQIVRYGTKYGEMISGTIHSDNASDLVKAYSFAVFPMILQRDLLLNHKISFLVGHRFGEDYMFVTKVLLSGCNFAFLNLFGYKYIGHPQSDCRDVPCLERYLHGLISVATVLSDSISVGVDANVICSHIAMDLPLVLFDGRARKYVSGKARERYLRVLKGYFESILIDDYRILSFPFRMIVRIVKLFPCLWFCPFMPISKCMRLLCHYNLMLTKSPSSFSPKTYG